MAYTIISQNNTTTTLADENGNIITVPARVTLATSTDYTIKKVNNNSVDLESSDGKIIRGVPACVVLAGEGGGGGGDQHNLGYYATQAALEKAHPTAEAGDWAIVGATDTVWIWDTDTNTWKDSDQKGQVTSVNGQTGAVVLSIPDAVQYSTMPTASADNLGDIVQFIGTTDTNYTNGYFYKCVSDGQDPATYSWEAVAVQASSGGLPSQTGNAGKFLTTDGTDASWSNKPLVNNATGSNAIGIGTAGTVSGLSAIGIGAGSVSGTRAIGIDGSAAGSGSVAIGGAANVGIVANGSIAIGRRAAVSAAHAIQISATESPIQTNSDANTFKVANANGNFEIMSADGTIPADRLTHAINKYSTMPTASANNEGWIVQFTGTTDSTYTHGYIYECKAQGTDPETYAWEAVEVQASSGGLPSQAGNAGKFLTTDGTDASWSDKPLVNKSSANWSLQVTGRQNDSAITGGSITSVGQGNTATNNPSGCVMVGSNVTVSSVCAVAIGAQTTARYDGTCIGGNAAVTADRAIQLGARGTNNEAGTFKVALTNPSYVTNNYKLLDNDGTIPAARHATLPSADGTYVLKLVITDGTPTLQWVAE